MRSIPLKSLAAVALFSTLAFGCADSSQGGNVRVIKNPESASVEKGGISPDKQADVQLLLQQRDPSTLRCYQDVLDEKHDRAFKGTVIVLLSLEPGGKGSAKVIGGTLNNKEVSDCLISKLDEFEYPQVEQSGTMQYVYKFEPAY